MKGPLKRTEQMDSCIKSGSKEFDSFRFNIKDFSDPQNGPFWALANFSRATDLSTYLLRFSVAGFDNRPRNLKLVLRL